MKPDWYLERRAWIEATIGDSTPLPGEASIETSPCGRYQVHISKYLFRDGPFRLGVGELRSHDGKAITTVVSNMGLPVTWVARHPSGRSYLMTHEDYQGYTVIELETGRRVDYIAAEAEQGWGFCTARWFPSDDGATLIAAGCVWAHEFEIIALDFAKPLEPPYPQLWRGEGFSSKAYRNEEGFVFHDLLDIYDEDGCFVGERERTLLLTSDFELQVLQVGPILPD